MLSHIFRNFYGFKWGFFLSVVCVNAFFVNRKKIKQQQQQRQNELRFESFGWYGVQSNFQSGYNNIRYRGTIDSIDFDAILEKSAKIVVVFCVCWCCVRCISHRPSTGVWYNAYNVICMRWTKAGNTRISVHINDFVFFFYRGTEFIGVCLAFFSFRRCEFFIYYVLLSSSVCRACIARIVRIGTSFIRVLGSIWLHAIVK